MRPIHAFLMLAFTATLARAQDPLPAWNDGPAKQAVTGFVEKVTGLGSPDFVPVPERIATFDNDGTLWCVSGVSPRIETNAPSYMGKCAVFTCQIDKQIESCAEKTRPL